MRQALFLFTYPVICGKAGTIGVVAFQDLDGDEAVLVFVAGDLDTCRLGKDQDFIGPDEGPDGFHIAVVAGLEEGGYRRFVGDDVGPAHHEVAAAARRQARLFLLRFFFGIAQFRDAACRIAGEVDIGLRGFTITVDIINGDEQAEDDEGQEEHLRIIRQFGIFCLFLLPCLPFFPRLDDFFWLPLQGASQDSR